MSFDPSQHNRATDGKFAAKEGASPEVALSEDDGFGAMMDETLRTMRERNQQPVRDGIFPPGMRLADFIIDDDEGADDYEDFDASRKFSSMRSYPGMNGFAATVVDDDTRHCAECADEVSVGEDGVAHHITDDGEIDYDKDAEHTAIDDSGYGADEENPVLFETDEGYAVVAGDEQHDYAVYDTDGRYLTTVTSVSDDHLSIEDEVRAKLSEEQR